MANKIVLEIRGDDKATAVLKQFLGTFDKTTKGVASGGTTAERAWNGFMGSLRKGESIITNTFRRLTSMQGLLLTMAGGYGLKRVAESAIDVAASFEQMEIKLNALTEGRGKETLDALNEWALEMPVNTRKAVDTFAMMKAMGLNPNIESMQTLVDVSVLFGEEAMPRVARALGQMQTLGKLSAEELNQLSEAGINARKYIIEAFGTTVEELQKMNKPIEEIIDVIWKGLAKDFGGAAKEAQRNWQGLRITTVSYLEEIERRIMEAGVFDEMKNQLVAINKELKEWIDNNEELIKIKVPEYIEKVKKVLSEIWQIISYDPAIIEWGLIGLAIGGKKWAVIGAGMGHMATWAENLGRAMGMVAGGILDIREVAGANFEELEKLVEKGEALMQGPFFRGKIIKPKESPQIPTREKEGGAATPFQIDPKILTEQAKEAAVALEEVWKEQDEIMREAMEGSRARELEDMMAHAVARKEIIGLMYSDEYGSQEDAAIARVRLEEQTQQLLTQERKRGIQNAMGDWTRALQAFGQYSETAFRLYQAFAIAEATVSGTEAAVHAWKEGMKIGGPPLAAAFAAGSALWTAAQIAAIASQSPPVAPATTIGTYAVSSTTGLPEITTPEEQRGGPNIEVHVHGPVLGETKEALADYITEIIRDGVEVRGNYLPATKVTYD